jgi:hypothetical protein
MMPRGATLTLAVLVTLGTTHCKGKTEAPAQTDAGGASPPTAQPAPTVSAPPAAPPTLSGFEGEIDLKAQSAEPNRPSQTINMLVRNDRIRLDSIPGTDAASILGGNAYLLLRVADKKLDIVAVPRKQVMELDLNSTDNLKNIAKAASPSGARPSTTPEPPPKLTKTGTKETIAGYACEDWEVTSAKDHKKKASLCVADLATNFFHLSLPTLPGDYGFAQELIDGQHFPLRVVGYDEHTGAESGRLEVTKFDPRPMDPAKFEIPPGFAVVDLMQMLGMLAGGAGRVPGMPSGLPGIPSNLPVPPSRHHHHGP